jgi:hypothetical protein
MLPMQSYGAGGLMNFNVFKDGRLSLCSGVEMFLKNYLKFYRAEESLGSSVVIGHPCAAHAGYHVILLKQLLIVLVGVLYTVI